MMRLTPVPLQKQFHWKEIFDAVQYWWQTGEVKLIAWKVAVSNRAGK
jgi:hypothetical protein